MREFVIVQEFGGVVVQESLQIRVRDLMVWTWEGLRAVRMSRSSAYPSRLVRRGCWRKAIKGVAERYIW